MTVVLAIRCGDGLVMAADSQITDDDRGVSFRARKLHRLADVGAWGGSGSRAVLKELEERFDAAGEGIARADDVARALQGEVLPVLRHHYDHFVDDVPGDEGGGTPAAYVLAAGYREGEPFVVEVNPNGLVGRYADVGFHAVGGGAPLAMQAHALLAHYPMTAREVAYGEVTAVRVLDALARTSPKVGGPLSVARITPDRVELLDEDDVAAHRRRIERWEHLEAGVLDRLFD